MQTETTADTEGGGLNIGFIEDGDYTSYKPFNLTDITEARFRVASAGPGGTIELRYDSPTGPLLGKTAMITPTGNWQTYKNVSLPLTGVPAGTHELFVITRNPGQTASLLNLNWIDFVGKGAAQTAAPEVTASATPLTGAAPLPVAFTSTATDPDGGTLAYAWDFGVPGTTTDTSTQPSPSYTYANQGNYTATLTVTDGQGGTTTKTFAIRVTAPAGCGTNYRDDFDGADLGAGWDVVRRDQGLVVSGGTLKIPTAQGDVYGGDNNAKNIVLRDGSVGPVHDHGEDQARRQPPVPPGGPDRLRRRRQLHEVRSPGRQHADQPGDRALRVHQRGGRHAAQHGGGLRAASSAPPTRRTSS